MIKTKGNIYKIARQQLKGESSFAEIVLPDDRAELMYFYNDAGKYYECPVKIHERDISGCSDGVIGEYIKERNPGVEVTDKAIQAIKDMADENGLFSEIEVMPSCPFLKPPIKRINFLTQEQADEWLRKRNYL